MSTTGTILKALQAVLLVTVLTPATVWAGPASNRQPAVQSQDQPANGEAKHINRGLILTPAEAASSSNAQRPVTIPAVEAPQVEIPALPPRPDETATGATNNFSTAASPAATTTTAQSSSIVTMPAPTQPATDTSAPATTATPAATDTVTTPAAVAPVTPAATTVQTPAAATTPATAKVDSATPSTKPAPTRTAQASHHHSHGYNNDNFNFSGFNVDTGDINRQFTKFFHRRDVRSILSQYGLD